MNKPMATLNTELEQVTTAELIADAAKVVAFSATMMLVMFYGMSELVIRGVL